MLMQVHHHLELYIKSKNNNICIFTKSLSNKIYENQIYVYIWKIDDINKDQNSYSKMYFNQKSAINEANCINIPSSEFAENIPYDIVLETDKPYKRRVCLKKEANKESQLFRVSDEGKCSTAQHDYSGDSFIIKVKNIYYWLVGVFYKK